MGSNLTKRLKIFLIFSLLLFLFTNLQCSNPTGPQARIIKDPRTYTWTIDTLWAGNMTRIWGSAPNDVYVGGWGGTIPTSSIRHFDGNKWNVINLPVSRFYAIQGIYGFSARDVWTVGLQVYSLTEDSSLICHFDGASWKEITVTGGKELQSIWGSSAVDIWVGGWNTLFHFDGTSWKHFPFFIPPQGVQLISISGLSSNDVYMVGARNNVVQPIDTSFYYLYHFNGNSWSVVDSSYWTTTVIAIKFGAILKTIDGALYSAGNKLYRQEGDNWIIMNDDPSIFSIGGSSNHNLFAAGTRVGVGISATPTIYNYNGSDWEKIPLEGYVGDISDIWTDGTETFMVDGAYVIHGK